MLTRHIPANLSFPVSRSAVNAIVPRPSCPLRVSSPNLRWHLLTRVNYLLNAWHFPVSVRTLLVILQKLLPPVPWHLVHLVRQLLHLTFCWTQPTVVQGSRWDKRPRLHYSPLTCLVTYGRLLHNPTYLLKYIALLGRSLSLTHCPGWPTTERKLVSSLSFRVTWTQAKKLWVT